MLSYIKEWNNTISPSWIDLEIVILSEVRKRQISYDITYMWNLKKKKKIKQTYKIETDSQPSKTNIVTKGERWQGGKE